MNKTCNCISSKPRNFAKKKKASSPPFKSNFSYYLQSLNPCKTNIYQKPFFFNFKSLKTKAFLPKLKPQNNPQIPLRFPTQNHRKKGSLTTPEILPDKQNLYQKTPEEEEKS